MTLRSSEERDFRVITSSLLACTEMRGLGILQKLRSVCNKRKSSVSRAQRLSRGYETLIEVFYSMKFVAHDLHPEKILKTVQFDHENPGRMVLETTLWYAPLNNARLKIKRLSNSPVG